MVGHIGRPYSISGVGECFIQQYHFPLVHGPQEIHLILGVLLESVLIGSH